LKSTLSRLVYSECRVGTIGSRGRDCLDLLRLPPTLTPPALLISSRAISGAGFQMMLALTRSSSPENRDLDGLRQR